MNKLKDEIRKNYTSLNSPIAFSGISNIRRYYPQASAQLIREALAGNETYTLYREPKRPKHYNPVYVRKPREIIQADLIDLQKLANNNKGIKYLLTVIDSYTRFAWVRALKDKKSDTVLNAFKDIVEHNMNNEIGEVFLADQGSEFINSKFRTYLRNNNVEVRLANNKAPHIERFNRTLQNLIFRYLEENETETYYNQLDNLVRLYNNRFHRTIKMSPYRAETDEMAQKQLSENIEYYYKKAVGNHYLDDLKTGKEEEKRKRFKIGDLVRIAKYKTPFGKGYYQSFKETIYEISEVLTHMPIVMYKLKNTETNQPEIGTWYAEELQLVAKDFHTSDNVFKIEKILKRRINPKTKKEEVLIKWKNWSNKFNSWEPASAIKDINNG